MSYTEHEIQEGDLVSVVVPVYNVEKYVAECIESIIGQTYKNWEMILVLDLESTDDSSKISEAYCKMDSRIRYVTVPHISLGVARNAGLDAARGEWVCFVDSDDLVDKEYIETLLRIAKEYHCDTVQCGLEMFDDGDECPCSHGDAEVKLLDYKNYFIYLYEHPERGHNPFACWCNIYHVSLFKEVRFRNIRYAEDSDFTPRIIYAAKESPIAVTDKKMYFYRQREGSILHSQISMARLDRFHAKKNAMEFWKQHDEYEMVRLFFPDYFNCMVVDYIDLADAFPERKDEYKIIKDELLASLESEQYYFSPNTVLHPRAKKLWEELQSEKQVVVYGYGAQGKCVCKALKKRSIPIAEIWDKKIEEEKQIDQTRLRKAHARLDKDVAILILIENHFVAIQVEMELRNMGYRKFWSLRAVKEAIRYREYQLYLPELLENYRGIASL